MFRKLAYIAAFLIVSGCATESQKDLGGQISNKVIESSCVDPETGNLIAWWMVRREGTPKGEKVPVLVTHPYAIFIQWPNEEWCPDSVNKRIYIFYDNVVKKSYQTRDFDTFLNILAAQPHNISLLQFETCSDPRCWMPEEHWNRLEKVLAEGNRKWAVNPAEGARTIRICYCVFDWDFVFPGDKH